MAKKTLYTIQRSSDTIDILDNPDDALWMDWAENTDPVVLLKDFVGAVSNEDIDDVNDYWRVIECEIEDIQQPLFEREEE